MLCQTTKYNPHETSNTNADGLVQFRAHTVVKFLNILMISPHHFILSVIQKHYRKEACYKSESNPPKMKM